MKLRKSQLDAIFKVGVILFLGYIAVCCVFPGAEGSVTRDINAYIARAFRGGASRICVAVLIAWFGLMIWDRRIRRAWLTWVYMIAAFLFTGASVYALRGVGGGSVAQGILEKISGGRLYGLTLVLLLIPFREQIFKAVADIVMTVVSSAKSSSLLDRLRNFEFPSFTTSGDDDEEGDADPGGYDCPASCKPLQELFDAHGINAFVVDTRDGNTTRQYIIRLEGKARLSQISKLTPEIAMALRVPARSVVVNADDSSGNIIIAVNKKDRQTAEFNKLLQDKAFMKDKDLIPIGIQENEEPLHARLDILAADNIFQAATIGCAL